MNDEKNDRLSYKPQESSAKIKDLGVEGLGVLTKGDAQTNLEKIDTAINGVNANRASLGALQNRLQSTISNLETKSENLSAANSRIRDTDIALESAELTKGNILSAAATSVLAQANNAGSSALKLIG
jgi:flagellin